MNGTMTETVSDILVQRQRQFEHGGLGRPVALSFGVHTLLIVGLVLLPAAWFQGKPAPKTMVISLGAGSVGVKRSGQLTTGGKKVDEVVEPKKQEPILPVAPPKAVTPDPAAAIIKTPPKTTDKPVAAAPAAAPPKPATGAKVAPGSARVETGAKGMDIGLSSAGGGNNSPEMDSCCREYFQQMYDHIDAAWLRNQGAVGEVSVDFVILRDGTIPSSSIRVSKESGNISLDLAAERAIRQIHLAPLPDAFTGPQMNITLRFTYIR
jgi:TonB family protein